MKRVLTPAGIPFSFTPDNDAKITEILKRYPPGREASAVLPLLDLAQRQMGGWISKEAVEHVASRVGLSPLKTYEVASFYTMFNLAPRGRYLVQICTTTPCGLCGAEDLMDLCRKKLNVNNHETTADGLFTLTEVECLGACVNGPIVQINDDYYEDLDPTSLGTILDQCAAGNPPIPGSSKKRQGSSPINTTGTGQ